MSNSQMEYLETFARRSLDIVNKNYDDLFKNVKISLFCLFLYFVATTIYQGFFGPLSSLPGPWWGRFLQFRKKFIEKPALGFGYLKLLELHKKYGLVVRLGPNYITVSDKEMINQVLAKDDLVKSPAYDNFTMKHLLSIRDKAKHKQRRRIISSAFSMKYISSTEPLMHKCIEALFNRMDDEIAKTRTDEDGYGIVDIWVLLRYLALDVIGEAAFGCSFKMLEHNDHPVPRNINKALHVLQYMITEPYLTWFYKLFGAITLFKPLRDIKKFTSNVVQERTKSGQEGSRKDILQVLVDAQNAKDPTKRLTFDDIGMEMVLLLIAGSDTTSGTLGFVMIELLRNPETLSKLRQEIDATSCNDDDKPLCHEELKNLPYLNAVINETMRFHWIGGHGVDRIATEDTILGRDLFVPKGTIINANIYDAHMNPEYWKEPNKFMPERWLPGAEPPPSMDAYYPFSAGTRNCIGKNFALQEMRLTIANIVKLYDLKPIARELEDAKDIRHYITCQPKNNSFKCLVKRR